MAKRSLSLSALAANEETICIFLFLCKLSDLKFTTWLPLPLATYTYSVAFQKSSVVLKSFKTTKGNHPSSNFLYKSLTQHAQSDISNCLNVYCSTKPALTEANLKRLICVFLSFRQTSPVSIKL